MAMTLGGRAAEEIVFGEITTGASNDLEKVTETAKQMVMRFGMSERLGPRVFGHDRGQPFLGREFSSEPDYSDEIAREIDDEIRRIVESAHQTAKNLLNERRDDLERVSKLLLERETIDAKEFVALLEGKSAEEVFVDEEEPPTAGRARARAGKGRPRGRPPESAPAPRIRRRRRLLSRGPDGEVDGRRQRDARLVLRRGALPRPRGGDRAWAGAGRGWGRDPRRRRRIDPAGRRARRCRGGAAAGRPRRSRG